MRLVPSGISQCPNPVPYRPIDRSRRQVCRAPRKANSVQNPYCGCPWQNEHARCHSCEGPGTVQVRIIYPAEKCLGKPCLFTIPPAPCRQKPAARKTQRQCAIDWTVDEPGPNDSYGLNGLNWYDWQMEYHNKEADQEPMRAGLSLRPPPNEFPNLVCQLPIECYARSPGSVKCPPFPGRVNYSRDWRCCEALPPPAWRPSFA